MYKVVHPRCLPTYLPITPTIVSYLLLDNLNAPLWVYGIIGTLIFIMWCIVIWALLNQKYTEIKWDDNA